MSAQSLSEVLEEVNKQLTWVGPNGKVMGHVVLKRAKAEVLFIELKALLEVVSLFGVANDNDK